MGRSFNVHGLSSSARGSPRSSRIAQVCDVGTQSDRGRNVRETTLRLLHLPYSQIAEFQGCAFSLKADIAFLRLEARTFPG